MMHIAVFALRRMTLYVAFSGKTFAHKTSKVLEIYGTGNVMEMGKRVGSDS